MADGSFGSRMGVEGWVAVGALAIALISGYVTLTNSVTTTQSNEQSIQQDIKQLQDRVYRLEERVGKLESDNVKNDSALTEIETQFRASDEVRNLMHQDDFRHIGLLWQKVYGQPFPAGASYLPSIGQQK